MDSIIVIVFALAMLPYVGLPRTFDTPIVIVLVGALLYALYVFIKRNNITFRVPLDDPDDFLNSHDVMGTDTSQHTQEEPAKHTAHHHEE